MELQYGRLFDKAWAAMRENLALCVGLTLVYFLASGATTLLPGIGHLIPGILSYGYLICLLKIRNQKKGEVHLGFADFFWPFMDFNRFIQVLLLYIMMIVIICIGIVFLVIPGIYLGISFLLAATYFVMRKEDSVEALRMSMRLICPHWWFVFGMFWFVALLNLCGALCFGVGVFVTMPLSYFMAVELFEALEKDAGSRVVTEVTPEPS